MSSERRSDNRNFLLTSALLVVAALLFYGTTVRPGHNWDGDYALYILQAKNIVEGTPYAQTNFIPDDLDPIHPALYPAGLPLLLAPFYYVAGVNLEAMKWLGIASFVLWLPIFAQLCRRYLRGYLALAPAALCVIQPNIWDLKDTIYSEFPFMLFAYTALLLADRLITAPAARRNGWMVAALAISVSFTYLTRNIAVVLFPAILLVALYRRRSLLQPVVAALAVAVAIIAAVQWR